MSGMGTGYTSLVRVAKILYLRILGSISCLIGYVHGRRWFCLDDLEYIFRVLAVE